MTFFKYRHRVLVVINVCYLIFFISIFFSSPINKFYRSSGVALLYSTSCFLNDMDVFECCLSLYHLVVN